MITKQGDWLVHEEVLQAEDRIRPYIRETPLEPSPYLSRLVDGEVLLKLENLQTTNSFKLRGAANKLLILTEPERKAGVITASTGNHGSACAYMCNTLGVGCTVYVPANASEAKLEVMRRYGAEIRALDLSCVEVEEAARQEAAKADCTFISPYNDRQIIGGQGTIAMELLRQAPTFDCVVGPLGGGGLMSGIGGYLKATRPDVRVIGCEPYNSAMFWETHQAGGERTMTRDLPTISDGTAGGAELGSITLDICRQVVDDYYRFSEAEIMAAVRLFIEKQYMLVEGSGSLPVAALVQEPETFRGRTTILVISGSKISLPTLQKVLNPSV